MSFVTKVTRKSMLIRPSGRSTDYIINIFSIFVYDWDIQNTMYNRQ
jgi:hypothetical protein